MQNFSMKCFRSFQIFGVKSALLFLVLAANLIIIPAKAQDNSASDAARFEISRAAVIDLARIIRESEATARVRVLLDGKSAEFQQEFAEKETQLLAKEKELKAKESLIYRRCLSRRSSRLSKRCSGYPARHSKQETIIGSRLAGSTR